MQGRPGRMKDRSEDTFHGQIANRADSPILGAKERSNTAEHHARCHCLRRACENITCCELELMDILQLQEARGFPICWTLHGERCLGRHGWTHHRSGSWRGICSWCRAFTRAVLESGSPIFSEHLGTHTKMLIPSDGFLLSIN